MNIIIPGEPIPKGRPRMTRTGHTYTPARTRRYEKAIADAWREQSGEHLTGAIRAAIRAYFKIPSSQKKAVQEKMGAGLIRPTKRPDLDNIIKILDALNGLAYDDDSQIVEIRAEKFYGTEPRLEINLEEIHETV